MTRDLTEGWEYGVLGLKDPDDAGGLAPYFDFIRDHLDLPGDVCEVGVFRGRSLIATGLHLRRLGSDKRVVGFDSFAGFPTYAPEDEPATFEALHEAGAISDAHLARVRLNREHLAAVGRDPSPSAASSSGDFGGTSVDAVLAKAAYLGLENVDVVEGPFAETMTADRDPDRRFMAALVDCDLYESYRVSLPYVWERLVPGGFVFLDEYYSLKFPGARVATDRFFADLDAAPELLRVDPNGFERWGVWKPT